MKLIFNDIRLYNNINLFYEMFGTGEMTIFENAKN